MNYIQLQKQQSITLKKLRKAHIDDAVLWKVLEEEKEDLWQKVRGIVSKKPAGLTYQKQVRNEWK